MAIPEAQLDTWSSQGAVTTSAQTYQSIKSSLESPQSNYHDYNVTTYLQGSYSNDTNIRGESDVDIVLELTQVFYRDISQLSASEVSEYNSNHSDGTISHAEFKDLAVRWIANCYPGAIAGNKAVYIEGDGNRRNADVLIATQFRRYLSYSKAQPDNYIKGICFFLPDGTQVENFPKIQAQNCTQKHQDTHNRFKPVVRIFKNMRQRMIATGLQNSSDSPSYFLEGMLSNVPNYLFENSHQRTVENCYSWLRDQNPAELTTSSRLHWLCRDEVATSWTSAKYFKFLEDLNLLWRDW